MPLPLGGTSNHFPTALLKRLGAWDPYNVTEDADLGLRLAQEGYRSIVLDSVTEEEAPTRLGVWIRPRTRWLKGYMQTYTVHMRRPAEFYRRVGPRGFLGFQFMIGGTVAAALLHPLWLVGVAHWLIGGSMPGPLRTICVSLLIAGNLSAMAVGALVAIRHRQSALLPTVLTIPVYWLLISAAGYRAVWHWLRRPFHWEKTEHGLTRMMWEPPVARQGVGQIGLLTAGRAPRLVVNGGATERPIRSAPAAEAIARPDSPPA